MPVVSFYRSKYDNANMQKAENILSFNAWVGKAFATGEDYAGALKFVATAPVDYFGQRNTLMLYDTTGYLMPNSYALYHDADKQIATMQNPTKASEYHVFTVHNHQLYKTTIDMTLNDGKGDVVPTRKDSLTTNYQDASVTGHFAVVERQDMKQAALYFTVQNNNQTTQIYKYNAGSNLVEPIKTIQNSYGVTDLKVNPYGKKLLVYCNTEKMLPILEMSNAKIAEIDISTNEQTILYQDIWANKYCNAEYNITGGIKFSSTNFAASPTGNLIRLADKQIYQTTLLSDKLVSENKDIFFGNFLNGFVANNNVRYYKTTKELDIFTRIVGNKIYEASDHLGNVHVTFSDRRLGDFADVQSYTSYYPFGMEIANRTFSNNYRFGFNGQEVDKEAEMINFKFRPYNAKIGKFLGVDPLSREYPWNSCYAFAENRVINGVDLEGAEYLNANQSRITIENGIVAINLENCNSITKNLWKSRDEKGNWPKGNIGFPKEVGHVIMPEVPRFSKDAREISMGSAWVKPFYNVIPIKIDQGVSSSAAVINEYYGGISSSNPGSASRAGAISMFAIDVVNWSFDTYAKSSIQEDKELIKSHLEVLNTYVSRDMNTAITRGGYIPDKYNTPSSLGNIANFILNGVNNTNDKEISNIGTNILKDISLKYKFPTKIHSNPISNQNDNTKVTKSFTVPKN